MSTLYFVVISCVLHVTSPTKQVGVQCSTHYNQDYPSVNSTCYDKSYKWMTSCVPHSWWTGIKGTEFTQFSTCNITTLSRDSSQYIEAYYRCCDLTENDKYSLQCIDRSNTINDNFDYTNDYQISTVSCNDDETLISCSGLTKSNSIILGKCVGQDCYKYINNTTNPPMNIKTVSDNICNVITGDGPGAVATARCCKYDDYIDIDDNNTTNTIDINCYTIWGNIYYRSRR